VCFYGYADADFLYLPFEYDDKGSWAWYWLIDNVSVDDFCFIESDQDII